MKIYILTVILFLLAAGCQKAIKTDIQITNKTDYDDFLNKSTAQKAKLLTRYDASLQFWQQKLNEQPKGYLYMQKLANTHQKIFKLTGDITHLNLVEQFLKKARVISPVVNVGILHELAINAISKHEFRQAVNHNFDALETGENKYLSNLLLFDGLMEIGEFKSAKDRLDALDEKNTFGYLIRKSKLEDHSGNLDSAIIYMEYALEKATQNKGDLYLWTMSNLADMYGHAGRIRDAYNAYLQVLAQDAGYDYALKGIAWIAFSNDKNTQEAKRILNFIRQQRQASPDILLLLAEIAEYEGDSNSKRTLIEAFKAEVKQPGYGNMYNKYLIQLALEEDKKSNEAIALAGKEILLRPVPQSYDLLAWSYYKMGAIDKAYAVGKSFVDGETFEPEAAYHLGMIYLAAGKKLKAKKYLKEALKSAFELGPNVINELNEIVN